LVEVKTQETNKMLEGEVTALQGHLNDLKERHRQELEKTKGEGKGPREGKEEDEGKELKEAKDPREVRGKEVNDPKAKGLKERKGQGGRGQVSGAQGRELEGGPKGGPRGKQQNHQVSLPPEKGMPQGIFFNSESGVPEKVVMVTKASVQHQHWYRTFLHGMVTILAFLCGFTLIAFLPR
jgi:hypothetical protein